MSKTTKAIKRGISLSLVLALIFLLSTPASAEQDGARLRILMKDGTSVKGELMAVRGRTLILEDEASRADISLQLEDLSQVIIKNRSRSGTAIELGLLGGVGGAFAGVAIGRSSTPHGSGMMAGLGQSIAGLAGGIVGLLMGAALGAGIGLGVTPDEKFIVTDMTQEMQDKLLIKLQSKSRFPHER